MEVQTSIHDVDLISKEIRASVPFKVLSARVDKAITSLIAKTPLKGFRKGKAPRDLVKKTFGPRVVLESTTELAGETIERAIAEHALRVIGEPIWDFDPSAILANPALEGDSSENFSFSAKVYVMPEPTITGTEKFEVTAVRPELSEEHIDRSIEALRKERPVLTPIESRTVAETGDTVEFTAREVGSSRGGSAPQKGTVVLGTNRLPPAVEEALRTTPVGGKKKVAIQQPVSEKKTRNIELELTIDAISTASLPEVDDAFARLAEPSVQSVQELRELLAKRLNEAYDAEARDSVRSEILNQLVTLNQFDVPPPLVEYEIRGLARQVAGEGAANLSMDTLRGALGQMATDRVRAQIIVDQVAKNEGIEPTVEEVSALIVKQAREQGQSVAALEKWVSAEPNRIRYFELEVVRSKVLELLEGRATVTYTAPQKVEEVTEEAQTGDEGAEQPGTEKAE